MKILLLLFAAAAVAGCGHKGPLQPPPEEQARTVAQAQQ